MHYDVITFGSALADNYIILKNQEKYVVKDPKIPEGLALHFPLGSKIEIEEVCLFSGGGGTNTAATFSKQGLKAAYVGKLGKDKRGEAIIEELEDIGIETRFIVKDPGHSTAYSLILPFSDGDRTIFVWRGAASFLKAEEIPWQEIKDANWFYLSPLSGSMAKLTEPIVDFACRNGIKVAINPGSGQLTGLKDSFKKILAKTDVFILNQEEASLFTGIPYKQEDKTIRKICSFAKGFVIITRGKNGALASDGKEILSFSKGENKVVDKTGAGDAFGAGFVAGLIKGMGAKDALQLAAANAKSSIKIRGAKTGLLEINQDYSKEKITRKIL